MKQGNKSLHYMGWAVLVDDYLNLVTGICLLAEF